MKKLIMEVELEYDDTIMHEDDPSGMKWFEEGVLRNTTDEGRLILHSNEIGDEVGTIKVLAIRRTP